MNATSFEGEGVIDASGGDGSGSGGGGSGGRIAIYYYSSKFVGSVKATGGRSSFEAGAAGTIYQEDVKRNFRYLLVSNDNREPRSAVVTSFIDPAYDSARTWLPLVTVKDLRNSGRNSLKSMYMFDEVTLTGGAHLAMESSTSLGNTMVIRKLNDVERGDVRGYLHVGPLQSVQVLTTTRTFPADVRVYMDGMLRLPPSILIKKSKFNCDGRLSGIKELTISETAVIFGEVSESTVNDTFHAGHFFFERLVVKAGGKLQVSNAQKGNVLETKRLEVKSKATLQGRILTIISDVMEVDEASIISVDGQGFGQGSKPYGGKSVVFMMDKGGRS